jgi:hypothetical protein
MRNGWHHDFFLTQVLKNRANTALSDRLTKPALDANSVMLNSISGSRNELAEDGKLNKLRKSNGDKAEVTT